MGVLDKFLDFIKMTDDDDYEDDFYDEDDFEDEDFGDKPKKSLFGNKKSTKSKTRFEDEEDEFVDNNSSLNSNVTPMRPANSSRRGRNMEVVVIKPNSVDDSREIAETLITGRTVILNLEGLDLEIAQRTIDFTSGAAFAIGGNLQKISNYIFLVTPNNVEISGDLQDLLNTSFDNSSMRTRF
ncbi:cell division inhibitor SepF [Aequitasia blattaphilus]|uniref:Cell division protein SepF n=1 Tax=Aequitasia blattaphilus TaxID=2949332 RepID=A0ABT1E9Q0_9FIRM|nr:cell division protein SepF [Aequitasia blattaphilus]MCP1101702.1 cell division protein SepF [Aequitasia blattaphilus]MCR8614342.1 cell division protein SepF [Aequitasia blattaphilus]